MPEQIIIPGSRKILQVSATLGRSSATLDPFLVASRASDNLTVCHPASHRATAGTSELEQCTQPNNTALVHLPQIADVQYLLQNPDSIGAAQWDYTEQQSAVATPRTGFSSSLWFRPPPAA